MVDMYANFLTIDMGAISQGGAIHTLSPNLLKLKLT